MSKYYFTQDCSIGANYYTAGSIASTADVTGGTLPANLTPNCAAMQPLDAAAIALYYSAQPQEPQVKNQFVGIGVQLQGVYWSRAATPAGPLWTLVGANQLTFPPLYY